MSGSERDGLLKSRDGGRLRLEGLVLTLLATAVGGGTVGVPRAFALAGWGAGLVLFVCTAAISCLSLHCLFRCADVERGSGKSISYQMLVDEKLPVWLGKLVRIAIIALFFGAIGMSLLLATHVLFGLALAYGDISLDANFISILVLLTVLPLCLIHSFAALQLVSSVSFMAQITVGAAVSAECFLFHERQEALLSSARMAINTVPMTTPGGILAALPIALFVFFCHVSAPQLFMELQPKVREYASLSGQLAMGLALVIYVVAGLLGYAAYGSTLEGDIMLTIAQDGGSGWLLDISRALLGLVLLCSVPLLLMPLRTMLIVSFMRPGCAPEDTPFQQHACVTVAILTFSSTIARTVPWVDVIMGILGASCVTFLALIVPGLLTLRCCDGQNDKVNGLFLTTIGLLSTPLALMAVFVQHKSRHVP